MTRVGALVIIRCVATRAGIRCVVIIAHVAGIAIVGYRLMRSGQWPETMVQRGRHPGTFAMALYTISRELSCFMIRVDRLIIIIFMAAKTGVRGIVIVAIMTSGAVIGNHGMCPVQRPEVGMDGEGSRHPVGCSGMAHGTIRRQSK